MCLYISLRPHMKNNEKNSTITLWFVWVRKYCTYNLFLGMRPLIYHSYMDSYQNYLWNGTKNDVLNHCMPLQHMFESKALIVRLCFFLTTEVQNLFIFFSLKKFSDHFCLTLHNFSWWTITVNLNTIQFGIPRKYRY